MATTATATATTASKKAPPRNPNSLLRRPSSYVADASKLTNYSHFGPLFVQYWNGKKQVPTKNFPAVQVKFKIYNIRHLNDVEGSVDVDFVLMLDWEDESLAMLENHDSKDSDGEHTDGEKNGDAPEVVEDDDFIPKNHFWPRVEILNIKSQNGGLDMGLTLPKRKSSKKHPYRVSITHHCVYTFHMLLNFRAFPNDEQVIGLSIKSRPTQISGEIQLEHPTDFRTKGHEMIATADGLQQWDISEMRAALDPPFNQPHRKDCYTMQIIVFRDSLPMVWQALFPVFCIDLLSFTAFGSPITHLREREAAVISLFLVVMAFKFVLNQKLPSVPYLTSIEIYANISFLALALEGMLFFLVHELANRVTNTNYRSDQFPEKIPSRVSWLTGAPMTNTTAGITSQQIYVMDKLFLLAFFLSFVTKNIWYWSLGRAVRLKRAKDQTEGVTSLKSRMNAKEYMLDGGQGMFLKFSPMAPVANTEENSNARTPLLA